MKFTNVLDGIDYELILWKRLHGFIPSILIVDIQTYYEIKELLQIPAYNHLGRLKGMRLLISFTEEQVIEFI